MNKKTLLDIHFQGGSLFYELAILVCPEMETKPILDYTNFVWSLDNIEGPYDKNGNKTNVDADLVLSGILNIEGLTIPFKTMNIIEGNAGTSWFDICFYEHVLRHVLKDKYPANSNTTIHPEVLVKFFEDLLPKLYAIFNFKIAMIGVEVGGMYNLEYFETNRVQENHNETLFYVGKKEYATVHNSNKNLLKVLN